MAVLLECDECYQNYTVPTAALGPVTPCPWCGAKPAGAPQDQSTELTARSHADNGSPPSPLASADRTDRRPSDLAADGCSIPDYDSSRDAAAKSRVRRVSQPDDLPPPRRPVAGGTYVPQAVLPARPAAPMYGGLYPMYGPYPLYPASGTPPVVRRPRGLPALAWLFLGIALGACVVLMVIVLAPPDALDRSRATKDEAAGIAVQNSSRGAPAAATASNATNRGMQDLATIRPRDHGRANAGQNDERERQLIQAIIREEMRRERGEGPAGPGPLRNRQANEVPGTTPRWMSGRPPPIDDPEDDSPGLGLKVIERTAREEATAMMSKAAAIARAPGMAADQGPFDDDARQADVSDSGETPRAGEGVTLRRALRLRKTDGGGVQLSRGQRATLVRFDGDDALVSVELSDKDTVQGYAPVVDLGFGGKRVKPDSTAAIHALVAAQIKCDKNPDSGLVERIDGSFKMTDALMEHVAMLPNVAVLKLSFSNVKNDGLAHINELTSVRELILNETKVTDFGLAHLAKLTELEKLDLEKAPVSDDSLDVLKKFRKLKHLDLRGTIITPAGVTELEEALPGAKIRHSMAVSN